MTYDVVVVGSGPAGVHATYPLIEAGLRVAMVDGGLDSKKQDNTISSSNTSTTRSNALDILMKGSFAFGKTYELLRVRSNIDIIQTLAKGGLSEFWHGICDFLTPEELNEIGLPPDEIQKEYPIISDRVNLNPKPRLDIHGKLILRKGKDKIYRLPVTYSYRTSDVVEKLKTHKNFTYIPEQLVFKVKDKGKHVETESISIKGSEKLYIRSRYLILAAGSINTTRILLRSMNLYNYKTSFLTKSHSMIVCLHPQTLIKNSRSYIKNPGQVAMMSNATKQKLGTFVQIYKFNPLMTDKALAYIPLPKPIASVMLFAIVRSLVIADVRFPSYETKEKYCTLKKTKGNGDILEISFHQTRNGLKNQQVEMRNISQTLKSVGLLPLKTISDPITSHYGGGVPFDPWRGKLSSDISGRLNQAKRIYIADSSPWRALPAKPLALTIMANASRVSKHVLEKLQS